MPVKEAMEILLFDMDGVLLKPRGYHQALKDTVQLVAQALGFGDVVLTDEQIAKFESLGISSEWHSSALCIAALALQSENGAVAPGVGNKPVALDLDALFEAIARQPLQIPALQRGMLAIGQLAAQEGVGAEPIQDFIRHSEDIQISQTLHVFQELILGSAVFESTYRRASRYQTESYLMRFDQRLISPQMAQKILQWAAEPSHGAAIMTNRPSLGPTGNMAAPDADMGAALVGLQELPLIGYGETSWLADRTGRPVASVSKPAYEHALLAILAAMGWQLEQSMQLAAQSPAVWNISELAQLHGSRLTVFEDTPGGVLAVQTAGELLSQAGLRVEIRKIGIAENVAKQSALASAGALVYPDIERALASLNHF